jgi:signal transduction histidine kinase
MEDPMNPAQTAPAERHTAMAGTGRDSPPEWPVRPPPGELSTVAMAGIVHDLGNLIQVASSAVALIARDPDMPASQVGAMLARAKTSLDHAGALVRRNLSVLRDRGSAESRSCDAAACLDNVATLIEAIGEPGLVLDMDVEPALPRVVCPATGLQNAVLNLVFNARDAMSGRGRVAIAARALAPGPAGERVEIRVADQGVGMTRGTIARAFAPFFTTKSEGLGGVGLPMVDHFVRNAGGEILVESEPGVGTTITLRLPALARTARLNKPAEELRP